MASNGILQFSVASVVGDVLQQHGKKLNTIDLESRKANEDFVRRNEATHWLRKMVGVVAAKDLPAQPSEDEFRQGLRSGIILCNVLNKVQPKAVQKVVETPIDTVIIPDGRTKSASQYLENVRNFLIAVEELGMPTFEPFDLEKGGDPSRVVNTVLAMKSYNEWKERGGLGSWKYSENSDSEKHMVRKNSEPILRSLSRMSSEVSLDSFCNENIAANNSDVSGSCPLHILIRDLLADKKKEDIPIIVENMLHKVTEEFGHRMANQTEQMKQDIRDLDISYTSISSPGSEGSKTEDKESSQSVKEECNDKESSQSVKEESVKEECNDKESSQSVKEECNDEKDKYDDGNNVHYVKQLIEQHQKNLQVLKHDLSATRADMQHLQMKYQEEVNGLGEHLYSLADAASGYRKVLDENRKLYNQVQDLKGSIRVYCRVRPFLPGEQSQSSAVANIEDGKITIITPSKSGKDARKSFTFNQSFGPSATQEEVFSDMRPLVRSVLDGYNVCIFAYGQTGSGKTFTMSGPNNLTEETLGVNYRALGDLFLISEQRKNIISYEVSVQMIEIYNEQVRDLLVTDGLNKKLEIRNNSQKGLNVPDANIVPVASTSDVINLMNVGQKNRAVGSTAMNDRSSRSHSCLTVHVQGRDLTSGSVIHGSMHLVDLAGSERADKTEAVGDRLKEAQHINKSLSALGDVLSSLAQRNAHVPYRNSKLTQLLQDSLGGQAKTLMFVHISPDNEALGETLSTLKFAERVSTIELGTARTNKDSVDVKELKEQIANLKAALAKKESENLQQSKLVRMMSAGAPVSSSSWQGGGNMSGASQQLAEEDGNLKDRNNNKPKSRRQSLDLQDATPNPWQPSPTGSTQITGKPDSGKWVDKVLVNKDNTPDPRKIYPEQPDKRFVNKSDSGSETEMNMNRSDVATSTDESDIEAAASDSSEPDFSKGTKIPSMTGSRIKSPSARQAKSSETRSSIPPPRRASSNGARSGIPRTGRQPVSADTRRKTGGGK